MYRTVIFGLLWIFTLGLSAAGKPNFVIVMADDCTYRDMEVYGGPARTPAINKIAAEGMLFTHCFQATAMCAPTRMNLLTGIYPVRNGGYRNHSKAKTDVKSIVHQLKPLGYRLALSGKRHIAPKSVFPFEYSEGKAIDYKFIDKFLSENKKNQSPFCLFVMSNDPHVPWSSGNPEEYLGKKYKLPPYLIDTPETQKAYARYLAEITHFDSEVERVDSLLKKYELKENTVFIILGEHGNLFPFEKWTCYDAGLRSAMIIRWPVKVKASSKSSAMIEYSDIVPTLIDLAGGKSLIPLDGSSFKSVLEGKADTHKEYVFGVQTTTGVNSCKEPYGIRSVRDKRYKLILNLFPENSFTNALTLDASKWNKSRKDYLGWMTSWRQKAESDPKAKEILERYQKRPEIEFYDLKKDPFEIKSLAEDPEYVEEIKTMKKKLKEWMVSQGDKGRETEITKSVP